MIAIVIALAAAPLPATAVLSAEALDVAVEELSGFVAYWSEGIASGIEDQFDSCADADECGYTEENCTGYDCTETFYSCGGNASFWASQRDAVFAKECTSDGFVAVSVCNPEFSPPSYVYDLGIDKCSTDSIHLDGFDWSVEDCDDDECKEQVAAKYLTDDYNDGTDFINASSNNSSGVSKIMRGVAIYAAVLGNTTVTLGSTAGAFVAWKPKVLYASFAVNGSANTSVVFTDVIVMGGIVSFDGGSAIVGGGVTDEASLVSFKSSLPVRLEGLENGGNVTFTDCTDVIIANTLNLGTVVLTNSVASVSNITNRGTVEISGGTYLYSGGSNHGTITVSGNVDAELVSDTNAGTIEVSNVGGTVSATIGSNDGIISVLAGSTATATIGTNVGTITISDSSTGTLAVTCNTGTITYAGNVITGDFSDGSVGITILGTCSATTDAQPTAAPTTTDTVTVDGSLQMTSSAAPTTADKTSLKTEIATAIGIDESAITDFTVTSTSVSRRRRNLLATYTWVVQFTVVVSLSSTSSSSAAALSSSTSSALTSSSFVSAVSDIGATVDTSSVTVAVATRDDGQDDDDDDDEDPCFSGDDVVTLESGQSMRFAEISVGDRILSADKAGNTHYSDVVFLPHEQNNKQATFVEMSTSTGNKLCATKNHLIVTCSGATASAGSLTVGQCVRTVTGDDTIETLATVRSTGVYTAVTKSDYIVVGGIVASPFAYNHNLVSAYYNLHRVAYDFIPNLLQSSVLRKANELFGSFAAHAFVAIAGK